jgi:hypothetical protein
MKAQLLSRVGVEYGHLRKRKKLILVRHDEVPAMELHTTIVEKDGK